jgi:hypothetical protein
VSEVKILLLVYANTVLRNIFGHYIGRSFMICTGGRFEVFSDAANDANLTGCYTIFICK